MNHGDSNTRRDGGDQPAPDKLVAALKEPLARRVFVPPSTDAAILKAARQHLARPERKHFFRPWLLWPTVAAACIALLGLTYFISRPVNPQFTREDLNRDGRVDILDAFQLAREMESGDHSASNADLNRDGIVDRRDAELIATHAVQLGKGGKS